MKRDPYKRHIYETEFCCIALPEAQVVGQEYTREPGERDLEKGPPLFALQEVPVAAANATYERDSQR